MVITAGTMGSGPRRQVQVLEIDGKKVLRFIDADGTVTDVPHTEEREAEVAKEAAFAQAYQWYGGPVAP